MTVDALAGRCYGPSTFEVTRSLVAGFIAATADDPDRWAPYAPPSIAAAALFSVAPLFLGDSDAAVHTRSVVHTEQAFSWSRPLEIGERLQVTGSVDGIRTRGPLVVVTFGITASGDRPWLESSSTFLLSAEPAGSADEDEEPAHGLRGVCEPAVAAPLPADGGDLAPLRRSASRADLVRYAAASGDFNPIHWDHGAARDAGLPGVIVHGLAMAAWLVQSAARYAAGPIPVSHLRARFRRPLRPGRQAVVRGRVVSSDDASARLVLELTDGDMRLIGADAVVTR